MRRPYCGIRWGSLDKAATSSGAGSSQSLSDVRAGRHACFDRLVLDLAGDGSARVRYVGAVHAEGTGDVIPVRGAAEEAGTGQRIRVGEVDAPLASQPTYAHVYGDKVAAEHGFYNIELRYDPADGKEFVVRFSSLPDAPTQYRPFTYPTKLVATGATSHLDLDDVRMKLVGKVDSTTDGDVHRVKRGKRAHASTDTIPAGTKAVLPVTVVAGAPGILRVAGKATFTVTKGKRNKVVRFQAKPGKKAKRVKTMTPKLTPAKGTAGESATTFVLPTLAGSTATTKKVCTKRKQGKPRCTKKKVWSSSETYTLHVAYSGSDEARASDESIELTVLATKKRRQKATVHQLPNAR